MLKRIAIILLPLLMLLASATSWAEVVYVHDELRLGVREQANSSDAPLAVVTTGARLEVIARSGSFVKVRTARGVEGWVNAAYLSDEKPSRLLLEELQETHQDTLEQVAGLSAQIEAREAEILRLGMSLEEMADNKEMLQQEIARYRAELGVDEEDWGWLYQSLFSIGLFLLGIFLGVKWYRHRISERMGGLEI